MRWTPLGGNRMTRTAWELLRKGEDARDPATAAARAGVVGLSPDVRGGKETQGLTVKRPGRANQHSGRSAIECG